MLLIIRRMINRDNQAVISNHLKNYTELLTVTKIVFLQPKQE